MCEYFYYKNIPIFSCFILKTLFLSVFFALCCNGSSTITQGQVFRNGDVLISDNGSFQFGFFSPTNSSLRYVGIWYSNISVDHAVWIANRNAPISNNNGFLTLSNDGNLVVFDGNGVPIWSSNNTVSSKNYTAMLLNDGNLEIRGINNVPVPSFTCWQSFDYPTDTYLPGMRVVINPNVGENRNIFTSWKSVNDPSNGNYSMGVDPRAAPQIVIWEGLNRRWRSGYWNGLTFTGVPTMAAFYNYGFKLSNPDSNGNMYLTYSPMNKVNKFMFRITWDGYEKSLIWDNSGSGWGMLQQEPISMCDVYNKCGANGYCRNANVNPTCGCFKGFVPKYPEQWRNKIWSGGCVRSTQLQCEKNDSTLIDRDDFLMIDNVKLPDFASLWGVQEAGCKNHCLQNCLCMAYAYVSGIGCLTWNDQLADLEQFTEGGNKLYIRVASSVLGNKGKLSGALIAAIVFIGVMLSFIMLLCLWKFGRKSEGSMCNTKNDTLTMALRKISGYPTVVPGSRRQTGDANLEITEDLHFFNYELVASSTNFFSMENKLGQGGFGPVYKGTLPNGQEIAVKKLSRKSSQGMEEFKNEIMLIAKLQHRNLVRILGCCIHEEERMLLYEYMPNKSLDCFIFDSTKKQLLDWKMRFTIIEGIARGLLYLHRDARCTIIHRDLKASNILLDIEMIPKISDFGMARIFGGDQDQANTNRVVGTYGYMSVEYAMEGFFSERSDVYSFGVLLLEIITGLRTTRFRFSEYSNLIEYTWRLWSEGRTMELVDTSIRSSGSSDEITRFVHIALLCVQDSAVYRPTMSQVVLWLETDTLALSNPREPTLAYSSARHFVNQDCEKRVHQDAESSNHVTITMLVGR